MEAKNDAIKESVEQSLQCFDLTSNFETIGKLCLDDKGEPRVLIIYGYEGDLTRTYRWYASHLFRCELVLKYGYDEDSELICRKKGYYIDFIKLNKNNHQTQ